METTKAAYKAKMEAQLALWSTRIVELRAKADQAVVGANAALHAQVYELVRLEVAAKQQIGKLESAAADGWDKAKAGFEEGWAKLSGSVEAVWAKIVPDPVKQN